MRAVLTLIVLVSVIVTYSTGAAVGSDADKSDKVLSRVKRGTNKYSVRPKYRYWDANGQEYEVDFDQTEQVKPLVLGCHCSFDECSCKDKTRKAPSKPVQVDCSPEEVGSYESEESSSEEAASSEETKENLKRPKPSKDKQKKPQANKKKTYLEPDSDEDQHGTADPQTGKVKRKKTFQEYYQSKRRQEILDFLKNYYSSSKD